MGGGITLPTDSDFSGTGISSSADLDAGWMGSSAIGYQFLNDIRAELELAYRSSDVDALSGASNGIGEIGVASAIGNLLYNFRGESAFTRYLGLGIGFASVDVDGVQPIGGSVLDDSDYADHTLLFGLRFSFAEPKPAPKATKNAELVKQLTTAASAPTAPVSATPKITPVPPPPVVELPRTYPVFFDWDKADLKPEAMVIVREVAANVDRMPVARIQATGHADRSGPDEYNLDLSRRHADAVRAELIRLGVSPADIEILWKGANKTNIFRFIC